MMIAMPGIVSQGGIILPPKGGALNDYTWEEISLISSTGAAGEYFAVGDRKGVILNGAVGDGLTFNNETYYCYILGFNHNAAVEGTNRIHFQFGYNSLSGGKPLVFIDSNYAKGVSSGVWFTMNGFMSNRGGWNGSYMRNNICPAFKNALPADLKSIIKTVTKYTDNTGGGSDTASYVTATTDDIFIPSEYEVFGFRTSANSAEQNYQAQYDWYAAGNAIKYKHIATDYNSASKAMWWTRSVSSKSSATMCAISDNTDEIIDLVTQYSSGFAPCFCV